MPVDWVRRERNAPTLASVTTNGNYQTLVRLVTNLCSFVKMAILFISKFSMTVLSYWLVTQHNRTHLFLSVTNTLFAGEEVPWSINFKSFGDIGGDLTLKSIPLLHCCVAQSYIAKTRCLFYFQKHAIRCVKLSVNQVMEDEIYRKDTLLT